MRISSSCIFVATALSTLLGPNIASAQICRYNSTEGLRQSTEDTKTSLLSKFDSTCASSNACMTEEGVVTSITTRTYTNFASLGTPINFTEQYHEACSSSGMTMCKVTNELKLFFPPNDAFGTPATEVMLDEIDKPVCFPSSCREDQHTLLNVYDKQCQLAQAAGECEVISTVATCPEGRVTLGDSSSCARDNPRPLTAIQINKNALYGLMDAQCADASSDLGPNNIRFCEVDTVPATVRNTNTYTDFLGSGDSTVSEFRSDCDNSGGSTCTITFRMKLFPFSETGSVVNFDYDFTDYPICVPKPCAGDNSLAEEYVLTDFAGTEIGVSLCDRGTCDLEIVGVNCFPDPIDISVVEDTEEAEVVEEEIKEVVEEDEVEVSEAVDASSSSHTAYLPIANLVAAASFVAFLF